MGTEVLGKYVETNIRESQFSWAQQWALLSSHPRCIFFRTVGVLWLTYFLWQKDWPSALFALVLVQAVGLLSVRDADLQALSETGLGKLALLHLHPANMTLQIAGLVPTILGLWNHSWDYFLTGFSLILVGHMFGWEKVDRRFGLAGKA